ncbi:hypothetical protein ACP70R_029837 [Stipagrostis hirtigluma subsp. patula]
MAVAWLQVSSSMKAAALILCVLLASFVLGCLSARPVTDRDSERNLGGLEKQEQQRLESTTAGSTRPARILGYGEQALPEEDTGLRSLKLLLPTATVQAIDHQLK